MTTISAHLKKYNNNHPVNILQRHNERRPGMRHSNKNINPERTHLNRHHILGSYDVSKSYTERIKDKLETDWTNRTIKGKNQHGTYEYEAKVKPATVTMVAWTVQFGEVPDNISEDAYEEAILEAGKFLADRYNHVIGCDLHKDESTIGLHLQLVPIDKNGKLNANGIYRKKEMYTVQEELLDYMAEKFPAFGFERQSPVNKLVPDGTDYTVYQALTDEIQNQRLELMTEKAYLESEAERLSEQETELVEREASLNVLDKDLADKAKALDSREQTLNEYESAINAGAEGRLAELQAGFQSLEHEKKRLEKKEQELEKERKKITATALRVQALVDEFREAYGKDKPVRPLTEAQRQNLRAIARQGGDDVERLNEFNYNAIDKELKDLGL